MRFELAWLTCCWIVADADWCCGRSRIRRAVWRTASEGRVLLTFPCSWFWSLKHAKKLPSCWYSRVLISWCWLADLLADWCWFCWNWKPSRGFVPGPYYESQLLAAPRSCLPCAVLPVRKCSPYFWVLKSLFKQKQNGCTSDIHLNILTVSESEIQNTKCFIVNH